MTASRTKAQWRRRLLAARRAVPAEVRAAEAASLGGFAADLAGELPGPVCTYLPVGIEPGAGPGGLLDALVAGGHEVLAPVIPATRGPLDWARYRGPDDLVPAALGTRQPTGPRLGVDAIARAGLVLVPALAVDRRGFRLGRGGGYYDSSLPLAGPRAAIVALVRDEELVARLPVDRHDVPVGGVLTPGRGRLALPR